MSISAVAGSSTSQPPTGVDLQAAVMKKAQDVEKATAEALLELVKQQPQRQVGGRINVLA